MAFVNERIPLDERREFQISKYEKKTPSKWTIDREKNIILFKVSTNRDEPYEIKFGFIWEDVVIKVVFIQETFMPNIVKWTLKSIYIPDEHREREEKILQDLRSAMHVYGIAGLQVHRGGPIEVIVNFRGKITYGRCGGEK